MSVTLISVTENRLVAQNATKPKRWNYIPFGDWIEYIYVSHKVENEYTYGHRKATFLSSKIIGHGPLPLSSVFSTLFFRLDENCTQIRVSRPITRKRDELLTLYAIYIYMYGYMCCLWAHRCHGSNISGIPDLLDWPLAFICLCFALIKRQRGGEFDVSGHIIFPDCPFSCVVFDAGRIF